MNASTQSAAKQLNDLGRFIEVVQVNDLPMGSLKRFVVENRAIALANVDGHFYAFEDRCLHWGVRLSDGCLEKDVVRCRAHGWKHDLAKGEIVASTPPGDEGRRLVCFDTRIHEGSVWVSTVAKRPSQQD